MAKSVKVHDDTHEALKVMKEQRRSSSIDEVIREMVRASTGVPVGELKRKRTSEPLTPYLTD